MGEDIYKICRSITRKDSQFLSDIVSRYHAERSDCPNGLGIFWIYTQGRSRNIPMPMGEFLVNRNAWFGTQLLNHELGEEWGDTIPTNRPNIRNKITCKTLNRTIFNNKIIDIYDCNGISSNSYASFGDIKTFLKQISQNQQQSEQKQQEKQQLVEQRKRLDKANAGTAAKAKLTKQIKQVEENLRQLHLQQENLRNLTNFIRKQTSLRYNPILDPIQNRIKTSCLYDGNIVVINGGPGTGKTTTMIQRLKYLIDSTAIEDDPECRFKLNPTQRKELQNLIQQGKDWVFFSPSELLRAYLSDAINKEGLGNTNNKVWEWGEFQKRIMINGFNFVGLDAPFKYCKEEKPLILNNHKGIINELNEFYLNKLRNKYSNLPALPNNNQVYSGLVLKLKAYCKDLSNSNLNKFVSVFQIIQENFGDEIRDITAKNNESVNQCVNEIQASLSPGQNDEILAYCNNQTNNLDNSNNDNDDEDDEDNNIQNTNDAYSINRQIKWFVKQYCIGLFERRKLNKRYDDLSKIISLRNIQKDTLNTIGLNVFFDKYYAPLTRGIERNMLSGIASLYKEFRKEKFSKGKSQLFYDWDMSLLEDVIKKKQLHRDEMSLVIGFINNLIKSIYKVSPALALKHKFVDSYNEWCRPVIGIDEATDFSELDIYAMESLTKREFSSLTLCGDVMQRLREGGISSWDCLNNIFSSEKLKIEDMKTSYRQSSKLLEVASQIYQSTIQQKPNYTAYMKNKKVPAPLVYISNDENDKMQWINSRIEEVFNAYGHNLPSIAIFLNNRDQIPPFVDILRGCDFFVNTGINVVAPDETGLATPNQVRVFSVDKVKGMEFDVVFFHNIDKTRFSNDLMLRYLYVGLSRAAFFLAITMTQNNTDISRYFGNNNIKNWRNI